MADGTYTQVQVLPTDGTNCKVTIRNPSPKDLRYESNTMNLQKVGKRAGLLANRLTNNKDLKDEQTQKNTDKA